MSRVIKTEVCLWLVNWQRNSIIWWAFVHLDLVSSCKGAKCSDKLSIDGFWRSGLFLLLYMEKTWEVLGASFLFFFFLTPSSKMSAGQSQAIIPCSWSDSHQGISLVWKFDGVLVSAALGPSKAGQHFSSLQLELGQRKNKLSLWAVQTNSLLLSTANHDFMFNYLHYIISPVLGVVHG